MSSGPTIPLAKSVWTETDFDTMGWHDNRVHAVAFEPASPYPGRLLLDVDYIIEWVHPATPAEPLTFWICPATLVFDNAWDLTGDINLMTRSFDLSLDAIERSGLDEHNAYAWTLAGNEFTVQLRATGFTQYLRQPPAYSLHQRLSLDQRGGLSFDQQGYTL